MTFEANDFPLLASMIGNTYGPTDDSIVGNFPDYEEGDTFRVPNLNGRSMVDIEKSYLQDSKYQFGQPDAEAVIGDLISEDGTGVTPPTIYSADTDLQFQLDPIDTMAGKIQNISLNEIKIKSIGQEPSLFLSYTPSITAHTDGGHSQGYSYFR